MDTLLNFSGGLDSTYCFYKYLKENPNKKLLSHFIHLINWEGREPYESKAVNNVTQWFKSHNMNNFELLETTVDYGNIRWIVPDSSLVAWWTGAILRNPNRNNIRNIIIPTPKDEMVRMEAEVIRRQECNEAIREAMLKNSKRLRPRDINILYPIINMWKSEIVADMPKDLAKLTWSCRTPTTSGNPCKKCHTCLELSEKAPWLKDKSR